MEILMGTIASGFYWLFVALLSLKWSEIRVPILIGALFRFILSWPIGLQLVQIQGTTNDAMAFERRAVEWSQLPWTDLLNMFDPARSYVISFVGAVLYKLTHPSPVMLNLLNAAVSVWLIVLTYRLAKVVIGPERARVSAWIVAIFPFAVLYGSVFRREVFGSAFFMLGLLRAVDWSRTHNPITFLLSFFMITIAAIFHGGYAAGAVGLLAFVTTSMLTPRILRRDRESNNILISAFIAFLLSVVLVSTLVSSGFTINKIGEVGNIDVVESIEARVVDRVSEGGSSYPDFLRGADPFTNPIVIPGRFVYFLFSPFPWDIRSFNHLLGLLASITFILVGLSIIRSRSVLLANRSSLLVLTVVFMAVIVFAISIDNIGTSIRHRTKFIYPLAALCAAPLFSFFKPTKKLI